MIELRWLEKETDKLLMNEHGYYYKETINILQYRVLSKQTDYSVVLKNQGFNEIEKWSKWSDVPVIKGDDNDHN